jgi:hypothetical protein
MEGIKEIINTLAMLAKAQSALCLLGSSWMFTIAWVFASERKKGADSSLARAVLGFFWLPGLLVYYLLPEVKPAPQQRISPTLRQTPETQLAPRKSTPDRRDSTQQRAQTTWDGTSKAKQARRTRRPRADQVTDDGAARRRSRGTTSRRGGRATGDGSVPRRRATSDRAASAASAGYRLRVLNGALKGTDFPLKPGRSHYIGTARNNDLQLRRDEGIARWHAVIEWRDGDYVLRDADNEEQHDISVNDIAVQVKVKPLREGDVLRLGRTRLKFERMTA